MSFIFQSERLCVFYVSMFVFVFVCFFHFFNLNVCVCFMCLCLCLFVSFIFLFQRVFVCVYVDVSVSFNLTHIKDSNSIRGFINVVFQLLNSFGSLSSFYWKRWRNSIIRSQHKCKKFNIEVFLVLLFSFYIINQHLVGTFSRYI